MGNLRKAAIVNGQLEYETKSLFEKEVGEDSFPDLILNSTLVYRTWKKAREPISVLIRGAAQGRMTSDE
jgi:hypothetical protein